MDRGIGGWMERLMIDKWRADGMVCERVGRLVNGC